MKITRQVYGNKCEYTSHHWFGRKKVWVCDNDKSDLLIIFEYDENMCGFHMVPSGYWKCKKTGKPMPMRIAFEIFMSEYEGPETND